MQRLVAAAAEIAARERAAERAAGRRVDGGQIAAPSVGDAGSATTSNGVSSAPKSGAATSRAIAS